MEQGKKGNWQVYKGKERLALAIALAKDGGVVVILMLLLLLLLFPL